MRREEAKLQELQVVALDAESDLQKHRGSLQTVVTEISTLQAEDAVLRSRDQSARQIIERMKRERILLTEKQELLKERRVESERHRQVLPHGS